jgi:hypothetical protein
MSEDEKARRKLILDAAEGTIAVFNAILDALKRGEAVNLLFADGRIVEFKTGSDGTVAAERRPN